MAGFVLCVRARLLAIGVLLRYNPLIHMRARSCLINLPCPRTADVPCAPVQLLPPTHLSRACPRATEWRQLAGGTRASRCWGRRLSRATGHTACVCAQHFLLTHLGALLSCMFAAMSRRWQCRPYLLAHDRVLILPKLRDVCLTLKQHPLAISVNR